MKTVMSTTISARIPIDVAEMINKAAKKQGITKSAYISNLVTNPPMVMEKGGPVLKPYKMPEEYLGMLSTIGGLGVGAIVYQVLKTYLPKDKFEEHQIESIAIASAFAGGIVGGIGIQNLLSKK